MSGGSKARRSSVAFLLAVLLLAAGCTSERDGIYRFTVVTDGEHTFQAGDVVEADLVVIGGRVSLEDGARLAGDLYLLSGSLDVAGVIDGDVTMLNGTLQLVSGSRVEGTVDVASGLFERAPDATIVGEVTATEGLDIEGLVRAEGASPRQVLVQALVASVLLAALAFVVTWSLPGAVSRMARTTREQPAVSGALGILVLLVAPTLFVLMLFTIILVPVAVVGFLLLAGIVLYGWVSLGAAAGQLLGKLVNRETGLPGLAAAGTALLTLAMNGLSFVPLLAALVGGLAVAVGVGAVFLTGFGRRVFVPASEREEMETAAR